MVPRLASALSKFVIYRPFLCGALAGTAAVWLLVSLYGHLHSQWPDDWFNALLSLALGAVAGALALRALMAGRRRMLTTCMHCHAVKETGAHFGKDDAWLPSERYLARSLKAEISHGLCPHCQSEHYNGLVPPRLSASGHEKSRRA
ncbi:MAG: hypothetical protein K9K66_10460 [Desulfarculaceae bacterium]|nr:hypothetical protein [Desulfarculaceae bacterium]MCF8073918.1 hypothetical protein [Desulfarculaceae bacterium]MCF8102071.1 hypothetical protein [Desulfarculaceae bacterium]MCF8116342.1 hypothetical protein [Desulfarculaceae bacterium]